jgi:hypothetical protein
LKKGIGKFLSKSSPTLKLNKKEKRFMADSYGRMRTNYFRVTDVEKLKSLLKRCAIGGKEIGLFERNKDGETLYAFGCESAFRGYCDEESDDWDFDGFAADIQTIIAPGDSVVIFEIGYEKLNYLYAEAVVLTADKAETLDMTHMVLECAAKLLGKPNYQTEIEY